MDTINFTTDESVSSFTVSKLTYLANHPHGRHKYNFICTGALVFDSSIPARILLLQRSGKDSMPNLWETPGGGCDDSDPSILHSVARELWEESGLRATRIGPQVGDDYFFRGRSGEQACKFNFLVDAQAGADGKLHVKIDPDEHQSFVWATKEDVRAKKVGDIELNFTNLQQEAVILEAFGSCATNTATKTS